MLRLRSELQVFFAFPQFGQDEPARVVEAGGEAVENAPVLPACCGRRPACQVGNVLLFTGRRVKDKLYEDHGWRVFLRWLAGGRSSCRARVWPWGADLTGLRGPWCCCWSGSGPPWLRQDGAGQRPVKNSVSA